MISQHIGGESQLNAVRTFLPGRHSRSRVVRQDVQMGMLCSKFGNSVMDRLLAGQVDDEQLRVGVLKLIGNSIPGGLTLSLIAACQDYLRTGAGQSSGNFKSDSSIGACDQAKEMLAVSHGRLKPISKTL